MTTYIDAPPIPLDPEDLEATRPADLDACLRCSGTGGVPSEWSVWIGQLYDECPNCGGTGQDRSPS